MSVIIYTIFWLLLILGIVSIYLHNDLLNPLTCYLLPISTGYILYFKLYKEEYKVSEITLICFCFGAICFLAGYLFYSYFFKSKISIETRKNDGNKNILRVFGFIVLFGFVINCAEFYRNGISGPFGNNFFRNVRWNSLYSGNENLIGTYSTVFLHVTACLLLQRENVNKRWKQVVFVMLLLFSSLFTMARTALLQYSVSVIYVCYFIKGRRGVEIRSVNVKKLLSTSFKITILILIGFWVFSMIASVTGKLGANSVWSKDFYLYEYIGYPIIAFDMNVSKFPFISKGYYSLGPIGKLFGIFGLYNVSDFASLGNAASNQFNVYSYLAAPYKDFGLLGVLLVSFLLGMFSGLFYWYSIRKKSVWTVFYSIYVYGIIMAFYSYQFMMTYYFYVGALLLVYSRIKIKNNLNVVYLKPYRVYKKSNIKNT